MDINFDDVPLEQDTTKEAPEDLSFDDVPLERPAPAPTRQSAPPPTIDTMGGMDEQAAIPVAPPPRQTQVGDKVPISAREVANDDPFANESVFDTAKRTGQQVMQSVAGLGASTAKGVSVAERGRNYAQLDSSADVLRDYPKEAQELAKIIKENEPKANKGDAEAKARVFAARSRLNQVMGQLEMAARMNAQAGEELAIPIDQSLGYRAGEAIEDANAAVFGTPDTRDKSFRAQLAQGFGSLLGFMAATVATGGIGGIVAGSASATSELYDEAIAAGADERTALRAAKWGAVIGGAEGLPILTAFKYLPRPLKIKATNEYLKKALEIAESGGEEALQEYLSQVSKNIVAAYEGYDPDRPLTEGALEGAIIGGILGTGTGAIGTLRSGEVERTEEKGPDQAQKKALAGEETQTATRKGKLNDAAGDFAGQEVEIIGETPDGRAYRVRLSNGVETVAGRRSVDLSQGELPPAVDPDQAEALRTTQPPPAPPEPPAPPPPVPGATQTLPPEPPPAAPPVPPAPVPGATQTLPPDAPAAPPPTSGPELAAKIREVARARQQAAEQRTAPQSEPTEVAEGAQAGGPSPAPPTTPPVAETPVTSESKPPAAPEVKPPPKVRTFNSESAPDVLHAAGLKTGEIAGMKKGELGRVSGLIKSALRSRYSTDELNTMPREEYNAAVAEVYAEIKEATAPKPAAPKPVQPKTEKPKAEELAPMPTQPDEVVEDEAPTPAPSIADAPSEGRKPTLSEEEKARILREDAAKRSRENPTPVTPTKTEQQVQKMAEDQQREEMEEASTPPETDPVRTPKVTDEETLTADEVADGERKTMPGDRRPTKAQDAIDVSEGRTGRVLEDVSEEGEKKAAAAQQKAKDIVKKTKEEVAEAEARKQKAEKGPEGAKMNPVEVARRVSNNKAASEIVVENAPDYKLESKFGDEGFDADKARTTIVARAKRMVAAAEKRLAAAGENLPKIPKRRQKSAKEDQSLSAEMFLLMEARDLANKKKPSRANIATFKGNEALLRSGNVDEYLANRRSEGDTANRVAPTLTTEEGDSIDAAETLPDQRTTPEQELERAEEGRVEEEDYTPDDETAQMPIEQERPKVVSEENLSSFVTVGTGGKKPVTVVTRKGKLDRKPDLAALAEARAKLLTQKPTAAEKAKATSELRALKAAEPKPEAAPPEERVRSKAPSDSKIGAGRRDEIPNLATDPFYQLLLRKMLAKDPHPAAKHAVEVGSFRDMMSRVSDENLDFVVANNEWGSFSLGDAQRDAAQHVVKTLNDLIGDDVTVYVVPDTIMDTVLDEPRASAYYAIDSDTIVLRQSSLYKPNRFIWDMIHEGSHAALFAAVRSDPEIRKQLSIIAQAVEKTSLNLTGDNKQYGFTDLDEFLSEFLSNPEFAGLLALTPMSRTAFDGASVSPPTKRTVRTALDYLKNILANIIDLPGFYQRMFKTDTVPETALDHMMSVVDRLFDLAPQARTDYKKMSPKERVDWRADRQKAYEKFNLDKGKPAIAYDRLRNTSDKRPTSNWNKLMAGGVPIDIAREINNYLKAEIGKSVDPATVPLLIADFVALYGSKPTTSTGNAPAAQPAPQPATGGGIQPPYRAPPSRTSPITPLPNAPSAKRGPIKNWLQRLALKNMTLDFLRQKHRDKFNDAEGNIIDDLIVSQQKKDNLQLQFAKPINEVTAEYTDLMKANPTEAVEMADLAMEATRLDVRLGPNADNTHLGKNKVKGLQGKQRLADLNQRFDALSPKAKEIYRKITQAYRDAHNANVEALAYNILTQLNPKLSTGDVMYLMNRTVNGLLDANDAALINDKIIFNALKNAQELKVIKGDYFPQMRFGNHVVLTTDVVTDPKWRSVPLKAGKTKMINVPVKTEVKGDTLSVMVDPTVRGASTAANRALREYAAESDLTLQGITTRYRDKVSGQLVSKGEQIAGRAYDTVYEAKFQTKGVHYFENEKDAEDFRKNVQGPLPPSDVLTREEFGEQDLISGSTLAAVVNRINSSDKLDAAQKKMFDNIVKNAIIASMDGNSARTRYQARRNVKGASKDIARAAVTYGQAAGNFNAVLNTQPTIRNAMERLARFQRDTAKLPGGGEISRIAQELNLRMSTIEENREPWRLMQNIATLSFLDKLLSPSYSIINGLQPMGTTMPVLAGRYGGGRANVALAAAYRKMGAIGAAVSGVKNSAIALRDIGRTALNTDDVIGSIRKNLGREYEDLIDRLLEVGAVSPDAGQEVAQVIEAAAGPVTNAIGRVDRFARQLPNTVEAINRIVTAVATYDLAKSKGKQEAIQEAIDTVFNTQGDYRKKNAPRWMQHPGLSWSLQFKKYGQMMYQLTVDMWHRSFKGASPEERAIARKQLVYLYTTQAAMAGVYGVSGLEILKVGMLALSTLGLGDGWDEEEEELRKMIEKNTNPTMASIINNGLLSTVTQMDFAGRLSQSDMALGFLPEDMGRDNIMQFAGRVLLGAPGGTVADWTQVSQEFSKGNWEKGLELAIPIKLLADTVRAGSDTASGKLTPFEAAARVTGFRSLDTAEESRKVGTSIRGSNNRKRDEKDLRNDYIRALDRKDRKAMAQAVSAIRKYNKELMIQGRKEGRKYRPLSPKAIRKYWMRDKKNIYGED